MPRPKKPHAFKLISGSRRIERTAPEGVQIAPLDAPPPPPEWLLDDAAVEEWHRLAGLLTANRMLGALDLGTLAHLCAVHGQIVACYLAGVPPKAALVAVYTTMAGAFGLTPAARTKIAPPSSTARENPFTRFRCGTLGKLKPPGD
jgi:phage terminase small subunit